MAFSQDEIDAAVAELNALIAKDAGDQEMSLTIEDMNFQGFDPKMLVAKLRGIALAKNIESRDHLSNLMTLATLGTMRGNKIGKICKRSKPETKTFLTNMQSVYGLKESVRDPLDITLIRISGLLAGAMAKSIASGRAVTLAVGPEEMAPGYPRCMCLSTFGSLIPMPNARFPQDEFDLLRDSFIVHQCLFDRVINSPEKRSNLENVAKYADIQIRSDFYTQASRFEILVKCGVIHKSNIGNFRLERDVRVAISRAASRITEFV